MNGVPVLELRGVTKQFPGHLAVSDVSLELVPGEFFALLGPSGCGKTTTLRLVAGFEAPTAGTILLNGEPIAALPPYRRNVSTVFQNYALFPHLSVRENIAFGLRQRKADRIPERVRDALELVRLQGKGERLPAQISGGERQRCALARSLVLAPDVLLLDEPLSALDPALRLQVRGELKELQRRTEITFLFVTHDQEEALSLADRIGVMHDGVMEQVGTPEEVYLRPRTRFVASFLGGMNWINGVGVRPEAVRVTAGAAPSGTPFAAATVLQSSFLGNVLQVAARTADGQTVTAEISRLNGSYRPGDPVNLWWNPPDELHVE